MLRQYCDLEDPTIPCNIEYIIDLLNDLEDWENPHKYKIYECFPIDKPLSYHPKQYELENLTMDTEDGLLFSGDENDKLDLTCVLFGFLVDDILFLGINLKQQRITISLPDGYIYIYY